MYSLVVSGKFINDMGILRDGFKQQPSVNSPLEACGINIMTGWKSMW